MRTFLTFVFLIMTIGGGMATFEAESSFERRMDALAALIGVIGLFALAQSMRRKIGDAVFARLMGASPETVVKLLSFLGLTVALPVVVYWVATGEVHIDGEGEEILAAALGIGGLVTWSWLHRDEW